MRPHDLPRISLYVSRSRPSNIKHESVERQTDEHKEKTLKIISLARVRLDAASHICWIADKTAYLEKQHETDPLIVRIVFPRVDVSEVVRHSWMGDLQADL